MMWLELNLAVQSWGSSVKSSGLSTQPCGAPVLSVVVLEVLWPTRTDWGLPVKKSRIQLQRELLRPSRLNLLMSCCGIIVLNAELKSMNSILTYESLFSRWVRARWRVEEIASSVERFGQLRVIKTLIWKQKDWYERLICSQNHEFVRKKTQNRKIKRFYFLFSDRSRLP